MLKEIKEQVLRGEEITLEQTKWLAYIAPKEELYTASHEISTRLASSILICAPLLMLSLDDVQRIVNGALSRLIILPQQMNMILWAKRSA